MIFSGYMPSIGIAGSFVIAIQLLSHIWLFVTLWNSIYDPVEATCQAPLFSTICWSLLRFISIESVMLSNHFICHPLLLLPSIFPSIRVFSNESALSIRWPKYWSLSFSISPPNEYSGLISFRTDWFDLPVVQGTLKSSPTPHFKSISSSVLSLLHSPTLTSIRNYWRNHSLDSTGLSRQSNVSAFEYAI